MIDKKQYKQFILDKQEDFISVDWDVVEDLIDERNDMEKRFITVCNKLKSICDSDLGCDILELFDEDENKFLFDHYEDEDESEDDD